MGGRNICGCFADRAKDSQIVSTKDKNKRPVDANGISFTQSDDRSDTPSKQTTKSQTQIQGNEGEYESEYGDRGDR